MPTSRFNPVPNQPYERCKVCPDLTLPTEDVSAHMTETMAAARADGQVHGHAVEMMNPSRSQRVERGVSSVVDDAITHGLENLDQLIHRGDATEDEITSAMRWHEEFADAWQKYCAE